MEKWFYPAAVLDFRLGKVNKSAGLTLTGPQARTEVDSRLRSGWCCGQVEVILIHA